MIPAVRAHAKDKFKAQAAALVVLKSSVACPRVWLGKGRRWAFGEGCEGVFLQLEHPAGRALWFTHVEGEGKALKVTAAGAQGCAGAARLCRAAGRGGRSARAPAALAALRPHGRVAAGAPLTSPPALCVPRGRASASPQIGETVSLDPEEFAILPRLF